MSGSVDLYNSSYGHYEAEAYRQIRAETYGEDLGQTSWVTSEESAEIPGALGLTSDSAVLELGCGSGRYALRVAERTGCQVVGVDINEPGIRNANQLAAAGNMAGQVRFEQCDVSKKLPFADESFDAVFSNDVLCHIPGRPGVFRDLCRVLKRGRRMLFSDALVIGGLISHEEVARRSSIGYYIFSPPGENERLLEEAGFRVIQGNRHDQERGANFKAMARCERKEKARADCRRGREKFRGSTEISGKRARLDERKTVAAVFVPGGKILTDAKIRDKSEVGAEKAEITSRTVEAAASGRSPND